MSSRITSNMLTTRYLRNVRTNMNNMSTLQNQLSTGKEISKASDNPFKASRIMQLNKDISNNDQYNENIKDITNWLDTTDTVLSQAGNVFSRVKTLLVSSGNAAYGSSERTKIQDEIKEKVNELSQILNTNFGDAYVLGGTKTNSAPLKVVLDADGNPKIQYAGNDKSELKIDAYKDVYGKITPADKTQNVAYNLDLNLDVNYFSAELKSLQDEYDNTNTTALRKDEIKTQGWLNIDTSSPIYKDGNTGEFTLQTTVSNTTASNSEIDLVKLKAEYNSIANPADARKIELNTIITTVETAATTPPIFKTPTGTITLNVTSNNEVATVTYSDLQKIKGEKDKLDAIPLGDITADQSARQTELGNMLSYVNKLKGTVAVYKTDNGNGTTTITASPDRDNTAYALDSMEDLQSMENELKKQTEAYVDPATPAGDLLTIQARIDDINSVLHGSAYKDVSGNITTANTIPTPYILTSTDVTNLRKDLDKLESGKALDPADPLFSLDDTQKKDRITEIKTLLKKDDSMDQLKQTNSTLTVEISQGVSSTFNITATEVLEFKDADGKSINISDLLSDIIKNLGKDGQPSDLTTTNLGDVDSVINNLLQKRSGVGARQNRMDSAKENNETQNYNMTDILSKTEDIDIAEKTMEFSILKTVYNASLQTSAKVLPQTIMDYL